MNAIKHGLYINNEHIDTNAEDLFMFTFSNTDLQDPQAISNSYSKTITLQGTSNNNAVFYNIYKFDFSIGVNTNMFNPLIRTPFDLYDNGNLLERGYIQLNSIKYVKNNPSYEVTLYGTLGDFFYSLMYDNETQTELTLMDLDFSDLWHISSNTPLGLSDDDGATPSQNINEMIEEVSNDRDILFAWDKNYIWNSWICSFTDKYTPEHNLWETFLTAVPTYSGFHDDFDNDHILVNKSSYPQSYNTILPDNFTKDNKAYSTRFGYSMLTSQREMNEWEVRDLRARFQVPAIRLGTLMQMITKFSEKHNNYHIVWDKDIDITNTKPTDFSTLNSYFWRSYIMLSTPELEDEPIVSNVLDDQQLNWNSIDEFPETYLTINNGSETLDLSNVVNPSVTININDLYYPYDFTETEPTPQMESDTLYMNGGGIASTSKYADTGFGQFNAWQDSIFGAFVYKFEVIVNDLVDPTYNKCIFINCQNQNLNIIEADNHVFEELNTKIKDYAQSINCPNYNIFKEEVINAVYPSDEEQHFMTYKNPITTTLFNLPKSNNVKIKVTKQFVNFSFTRAQRSGKHGRAWYNGLEKIYIQTDLIDHTDKNKPVVVLNEFESSAFRAYNFKNTYNITGNVISGTTTALKNNMITKTMLFESSKSPFNYLVDWCKLFNLRFRTDKLTRTIYIESNRHYYLNQIVNIDEQIDYSKDVNMDPTYIEHSKYVFGMNTNNENYVNYIYNKTGTSLNTEIFTNYAFDHDPLNIFEDNTYGLSPDYVLKSQYLNTDLVRNDLQYPPMCLMPKYEYTLWNTNIQNEVTSADTTLYGLQSFNTIPVKYDYAPKPCVFDKDFKTLGDTTMNNLVIFDKLYNIPRKDIYGYKYFPYILTDDLVIMNELNDNNVCFINTWYDDSAFIGYNETNSWVLRTASGVINYNNQSGTIGIFTFMLPIMRAYVNDADLTYYFNIPKDSDIIDNNVANQSMYDRFFKLYENDILHTDSRIVECYVFLRDIPENALRKFYYFNNTIWTLLSITDYDYSGTGPTKCKFLKVYNISNYTYAVEEPAPEPEGPTTDQDLYQCQWIIGEYGGDPFSASDLENMLDAYYTNWRNYPPNVDLFNEIINNITEGYITSTHTVEKNMFNGLYTSGVDFDSMGYYLLEPYGDVIVIPAE